MNTATFETGILTATAAISVEMYRNDDFVKFLKNSLERHKKCDWGDLAESDLEMNNLSLDGGRILSSYNLPENLPVDNESKIWIITEADRSATTILFPSDY